MEINTTVKYKMSKIMVNKKIDYNSIRIQTIGMEGFAPKMNCKFSFCLSDSE